MRPRTGILAIAFLAFACASPPAGSVAPSTGALTPSPRTSAPASPEARTLALAGTPLEKCQIGTFGSTSALCGYLTVPEDPATPAGRTIHLRVAVIPARSATPEPDPVFMVAGGPGGVATASLAWAADTFSGIHESRDIVLVDQRGVGSSNALLVGPSPDITGLSEAEIDATIRAWATAELAKLDADPRYYTTTIAMDDLDAVRDALAYEQINLFGASYGATAVQYYIRQHEDRLRSVVLDGATLLEVPIFERIAASSQAALDELFERCAADSACTTAYPDLATEFDEVLAELDVEPVTTTIPTPGTREPMVIDVSTFTGAVHNGLLGASTSAHLPWFIDAAADGRWDEVANAILTVSGGSGGDGGPVMAAVIRCSEAWARYDPAKVARAGAESYYLDVQLEAAAEQALSCQYVPHGIVPVDDTEPARTDVPVLLVVGSADPQDPPSNVAAAPELFPNSRTVVAEGHGHTVAHLGCMPTIVDAFIAAGTVDGLDTSCVADGVPLPPFQLP